MSSVPIHQQLKTPPHSIEAEQAVLGGLMINNDAWDVVAELVNENDFYRNDHRMIFEAIQTLANKDKPRDIITVVEWIKQYSDLSGVGGMPYVGTLANETPTASNIRAYAEIVRDKSLLRRTIGSAENVVSMCYKPGELSASDIVDQAQSSLMQLGEKRDFTGPVHVSTRLNDLVNRIDERFNNPGQITGLATGFRDIDQHMLGHQNGDMIVIAGRPSMGKTSIAMNFAEHATVNLNVPVLVFSMEMSVDDLTERLTSSIGEIPFSAIRSGQLNQTDFAQVTETIMRLRQTNLFIDDSPGLNITQLRARARRLKKQYGIGLVVVDYIQLMAPTNTKENRTRQLGDISRGLKYLGKELDIPVVVIAQVNRDCEKRPNKRPLMSDLRDCGEIEQDADIIVFMYRDKVYNEDTKYPHVAEYIIRKYRNGETKTIYLTSRLQFVKFADYTGEIPQYGAPKQDYRSMD